MDKFVLTFDGNYDKLFTDVMDDEEAHGDRLQTILETTCASELKKIYPPIGKKSVNYYWNDEIAGLRKETKRSRIKAQRTKIRGTNDATRLSENFKTNKRRLARMIRRSKERC